MDYQQALIDLEDAAQPIYDGINAIGIMAMGLVAVKDPYADGFYAVWSYLVDAERKFQEHMKHCTEILPSD